MTIKNQVIFDSKGLSLEAGYLTVYNVNGETREFTCATEEYIPPRCGIPAHAYLDVPPTAKAGKVVCRRADLQGWETVDDNRGTVVYSTLTGLRETINAIGPLPVNTTVNAPSSHFDKWDGKQWVTDNDKVATTARQYRDAFIVATDPLMVSDYSIDDKPLTEAQRRELTTTRTAYRAWPTLANWPLIELPALPQWLLIEAVNQGYRVPVWPELPDVA
ncbi:putative tail fiber assembly protein [Yersinia intermedia]|uniref:tail fiber assembly protein n=1 Tax=Yersinia intermedia TaxID=631 RepID=UPI0005E77199|nr:tail fiber assembly protein [Yersinia intermedia]CNH16779.1 putative tail fiber assembly protein [Yersinia intermedia]